MKIATFNINNVNRRLPNLLAWLNAAEPDVVCLQELKAADYDFPEAAIRAAGYGAVWRDRGHGTASRSWPGIGNRSWFGTNCLVIPTTCRAATSRRR